MEPDESREAHNAYHREYKRKMREQARLGALVTNEAKKSPSPRAAKRAEKPSPIQVEDAIALARQQPFTRADLGDMNELTRITYANSRANLAAEMMDIGACSLRDLYEKGGIEKPADALRILRGGIALMDQTVYAMPPESEEEDTRDAVVNAHRAVLATPEGKAATQTLMILRANELRRKREEEGK